MKMSDKKKVTLMIDTDVYHGLRAKAGGRGMGDFMSRIIRPHVVSALLEESYRDLALDENNNQMNQKWEKVDPVIEAKNIWRL